MSEVYSAYKIFPYVNGKYRMSLFNPTVVKNFETYTWIKGLKYFTLETSDMAAEEGFFVCDTIENAIKYGALTSPCAFSKVYVKLEVFREEEVTGNVIVNQFAISRLYSLCSPLFGKFLRSNLDLNFGEVLDIETALTRGVVPAKVNMASLITQYTLWVDRQN